jgi:Phage protein (N4 Gp49/phage Sf6 gene 66) family
MDIRETDRQASEHAKAPRVSIHDIETRIANEHTFNLGEALRALGHPTSPDQYLVTIAAITHTNGFTSIGVSACVSPKNYKKDIGERFAREDALKKFWPLMGYHLCEVIHERLERERVFDD